MVKERRTWDALKGLVDRLLRVDTLRLLRHEQDLQVLLARPGPLVCHVAQRLQVRRHERRVEARLHAVGETDVAGRDVEAIAVEAERLEAGGKVVRLEAGEGHSRNWLKKSRRGVNEQARSAFREVYAHSETGGRRRQQRSRCRREETCILVRDASEACPEEDDLSKHVVHKALVVSPPSPRRQSEGNFKRGRGQTTFIPVLIEEDAQLDPGPHEPRPRLQPRGGLLGRDDQDRLARLDRVVDDVAEPAEELLAVWVGIAKDGPCQSYVAKVHTERKGPHLRGSQPTLLAKFLLSTLMARGSFWKSVLVIMLH